MFQNQLQIPFLEEIHSRLGVIETKIDSISKTNNQGSTWLTTKEVAILLQVSTRTIQTYRDQGTIPFSQFGREVRYRSEDIQAFLMDHYVKVNNGGPEDE